MQEFMKNYWWLILLVVAGLVLAILQMEPPPPRKVTFAAGSETGRYYATASAYREYVGEEGLALEVIETNGSADNLALLRSGEVDMALVQGGVASAEDRDQLQSLGAVFYEPFWVFARTDVEVRDFGDLKTSRLSIGPDGSGTRALADVLKAEWGAGWTDASGEPVAGEEAGMLLRSGDLDAAAFVTSINDRTVRALIADPAVQLVRFPQAPGLSRRLPYLGEVTLLRGVTDIGADLPGEDIPLVAPAAQLVVRKDLHPAIKALMMDAIHDVHRSGTLLAPAGVFPNPVQTDLPVAKQAERYYDSGPTFLRRFFSFGVANFLERAWILAIPLATLAYPIFKAAPPIYRWRTRRRIYVWYQDLRDLEARGRAAETPPERELVRDHLRQLQHEVGQLEVPLSYTDDLYRLRNHIAFVNQLLGNLDYKQRVEFPA